MTDILWRDEEKGNWRKTAMAATGACERRGKERTQHTLSRQSDPHLLSSDITDKTAGQARLLSAGCSSRPGYKNSAQLASLCSWKHRGRALPWELPTEGDSDGSKRLGRDVVKEQQERTRT